MATKTAIIGGMGGGQQIKLNEGDNLILHKPGGVMTNKYSKSVKDWQITRGWVCSDCGKQLNAQSSKEINLKIKLHCKVCK
tara:strand:+ start:143 stop:385 length:243 start_codon:yes stop_codon:yes gene_type:complete